MTKQAVIDDIADQNGMTKADAKRALDATLNAVGNQLNTTGKVILPGFGTFEKKMSTRTTGRNPSTGETISLIPRPVAKFKAAKGLIG